MTYRHFFEREDVSNDKAVFHNIVNKKILNMLEKKNIYKNVKKHLNYRAKELYIKVDDILKNPMIYDYQKTLFRLDLILVLGIFWIIRGSKIQILGHNQILYHLFYSDPDGDKTTYNIGISIVSAYMFYIVQVYLPEKKTKNYVSKFSLVHRHEIFMLNQYVLAWKQFFKEEGICYFHEFEYTLNYNIDGVLTKEIYFETIEELVDCLNMIIIDPTFMNCDDMYKRFIMNSQNTMAGHLKFMDDQFPRWSEEELLADDYKRIWGIVFKDMIRIQNRLSSIEKYYLKVISITPYSRMNQNIWEQCMNSRYQKCK